MTQFWLATTLFVLLGLTPLVLATVLNRHTARSRRHVQLRAGQEAGQEESVR
jgi:hypothetical protein